MLGVCGGYNQDEYVYNIIWCMCICTNNLAYIYIYVYVNVYRREYIKCPHQNRHLQNEGGQLVYVIANHVDTHARTHTNIHYITLHYITLHYITLHYIYMHYIPCMTLACHSKLELEV